ncbi:hypothetical protein ASO20_02765 [Mycoplasma sp. (ex Biomphalaria glabrata)]|nr:hypothetical protein ASO20_02765 [Mycoplasma sp. (ex Biomphalaria glabrata)]
MNMFNKIFKLLAAIIVMPLMTLITISTQSNSFSSVNNHQNSVGKIQDSWTQVRGLEEKYITQANEFTVNQNRALEMIKSLFVDSTLQANYDQVKNLIIGTTNNADLFKIIDNEITSFRNESWKIIQNDTLTYLNDAHLISSASDLENNKTDITKSNLTYYGSYFNVETIKVPGFFAWNDINNNLPITWIPQSIVNPWNKLFATNVWISYVDSKDSFFNNGTESMGNYLSINNWSSVLSDLKTNQIISYNNSINTIANNFRSMATLYYFNPDGSLMNDDFSEFQNAKINNFFSDWGAKIVDGLLQLDQSKITASLTTWMIDDQTKNASYVIPTNYTNSVFNILEKLRESILIANKLDYLQNQNSFFNNQKLFNFLNSNNENITNIIVNQTSTIAGNVFSSLPSLSFTQSGKNYTLSLYEYGVILLNNGTTYTYIDLDGNVHNNAQVTTTSTSITIDGDLFTLNSDSKSYLPDLSFTYDNKNVTAKPISSSNSLFQTNNNQYSSTDSVSIKMTDINDKSFNYEIANKFIVNSQNFDFIKLHHDFANSTTLPNNTDLAFSWNFDQDKFASFTQGADFYKNYYVPGTLPNKSIPITTIEKIFFALFVCLVASLIIFIGYFVSRYYHERKQNYTNEHERLHPSKK